MTKAYIEKLKADTVEANRQRELNKSKGRNADTRVLKDWKPLTEQIEALMLSLSPAQRDRPWSMDELVARLKGRFSARPHPTQVGTALRARLGGEAGLVSARSWSSGVTHRSGLNHHLVTCTS